MKTIDDVANLLHSSAISNDPFSASAMKNCPQHVVDVLVRADAVCFDVDSTVCTGEGIDELAEFCGKGREVMEMYIKLHLSLFPLFSLSGLISFNRTTRAMNGNMDFRNALQLRLSIIQPSSGQIGDFLLQKPPKLTPKIT